METKKSNEVTKFMWYMCNRWNLDEARFLFGDNLGAHIYQKKLHLQGIGHDTLYWYGELDNNCRQKIVDRANEIYRDA